MPYRAAQSSGEVQTERAARNRRFYGTCSAGLTEWGLSEGERCGVREDILANSDLSIGDNIRIRNENNGRTNAFYIHATYEAGHSSAVRMVKAARDRFYADTVEDPTASSFTASFTRQMADPHIYRDTVADAEGECFETWRLDRDDDILITAPHGGEMEIRSDDQAQRCADILDTSLWTAEGFAGTGDARGAFSKWHLTSTTIDPESWHGLGAAQEVGGWDTVVSFHGFTQPEITVGGRIPIEGRRHIANALNANTSVTANAVAVGPDGDDGGTYSAWAGDDPENFVNKLSTTGDRGIQLEFPNETRTGEWRAAAETVADALATLPV